MAKILVIDDDKTQLGLIKKYLNSAGYKKIILVNSGEKGILSAKKYKPDIILIDIVMPNLDGFEICRRIKKIKSLNAKVILVTGYVDALNAVKAQEAGADECVMKVMGFDNVIKCIDSLVKSLKDVPTKGLKVLLVDDSLLNTKLLTNILEKWELDVDVVPGGKEAIEKVISSSYDICFMDIVMPEITGYQVTKIIRNLNKTFPIIALTTLRTIDGMEQAMAAGMDDYLRKPVYVDEIKKIIIKWCLKKKSK